MTDSPNGPHILRPFTTQTQLPRCGGMPWKVIETGDEVWHVQPAAEMRGDVKVWHLMLSFRAANSGREPRAFWAPYPLESSSKSSLFQAADRLSDESVKEVLAQHLA